MDRFSVERISPITRKNPDLKSKIISTVLFTNSTKIPKALGISMFSNFSATLDSKKLTFETTLGNQREVKDKSEEILLLIKLLLNKDK